MDIKDSHTLRVNLRHAAITVERIEDPGVYHLPVVATKTRLWHLAAHLNYTFPSLHLLFTITRHTFLFLLYFTNIFLNHVLLF